VTFVDGITMSGNNVKDFSQVGHGTVFWSIGFWVGVGATVICADGIAMLGNSVKDFSQVGHGTVCPMPSAGYSMDCPQCGHAHL
jgi:hypothetical protein